MEQVQGEISCNSWLRSGSHSVTWFSQCYLVLKVLPGSQSVTWFSKCYLVIKVLPGSQSVTWFSKYYLVLKAPTVAPTVRSCRLEVSAVNNLYSQV